MRRSIKVKPSKQASTSGFIGGLIFVFIGLFVVIPQFGAFGVLWTLFAIAITVTHGINAFSEKGIPTNEIEIDSYENQFDHSSTEDFQETLRKLKVLKDEGVITEADFEIKKTEILNKIK